MSNINGVIDLDASKLTAEEGMAYYDSLPAEVRKEFREAAFDVMPKAGTWATQTQNLHTLRDVLRFVQHKSSVATYGPTYPADIQKVRA